MVSLTGDRLIAFYRRLPPSTIAIVAHRPQSCSLATGCTSSGLANNDPISWTAGISHHLCRLTCGRPAIDPNVGFITQTLGHQAAMDLCTATCPWWNYYQGLGQPLAGRDAVGGPLSPDAPFRIPVGSGLVPHHPGGHRRRSRRTSSLGGSPCPIFFATVAGMLFALNGTYAWLGNAVLNPVAFLPMSCSASR